MAETTCSECDRLRDSYRSATIRYMKLCEIRGYIHDPDQDRQLFSEMNDAMLAFMAHQTTHSLKPRHVVRNERLSGANISTESSNVSAGQSSSN